MFNHKDTHGTFKLSQKKYFPKKEKCEGKKLFYSVMRVITILTSRTLKSAPFKHVPLYICVCVCIDRESL